VNEKSLVSMMVGRSIDQLYPKSEAKIGEPLLELRHVNHGRMVRDISFTLRAGEILGIAGLVGSGRTELALTIFGLTPASSGEILVAGKPVTIDSPERARDLGIAYVPEDRGLQGLIRPQTIAENIALTVLKKLARWFIVDQSKEDSLARDFIARLGIRTRGPAQTARQLSGGNQQKVVLAKWLAAEPRILIMDEPTRGIDVGAKSEIHALMSRLAQNGLAILMISSELPEVLGMSDRILVMNGGRIVGEIARADATPETVGAAMTLAAREAEAA
jgi:ABC-type sugar transport system ATPase subunit